MTTTIIDLNLIEVYKGMIGLNNIQNISNNSTLYGALSINSNFYISGNSLFNNSITLNSSLTVSGNTNILNNVSILSSLNISGISIINSNTSIASNLQISGNSFINNSINVLGNSNSLIGSTTISSQLNISGSTRFENGIITNNISSLNNNLNINAQIINIGDSNATIFINGSILNEDSNTIQIIDKLITMNLTSGTYIAADIGNLSGIQIGGTGGTGFIQTTVDALRYQAQLPSSTVSGYILSTDNNYNLNISGNSTLLQLVSMNSSLYVSNISIMNSTTIYNSLNISGFSLINGVTTLLSTLNISGIAILNNSTSINSSLNISGKSLFNNSVNIINSVNISGNTLFKGYTTMLNSFNISGNSIINGFHTINNSLNISGTSLFNSVSIFSSLVVSNSSIIQTNMSINSNLAVSGQTILNGATTINSSINISGISIILGQTTLLSNLNISGQIVAPLTNYTSNSYAKLGGIPNWGLYRTGGVVKIKLNDTPPTLILTGASFISLSSSLSFTDPGVYANDVNDGSLIPYLTSIASTTMSNIITTPIAITGSNTIITQTSSLSSTTYTLTYNATNILGLSNSINRTLQININNIIIPFVFSNISWGYDGGTGQQPIYSNNNMTTSGSTSWFFNSTSLSNINFNYNNNWTCVLKIKQAIVTQLEIGWDFNQVSGNYNTNQASHSWLNAAAPIYCSIYGVASSFQSNVSFNTTIYNQSAINIAQTTGYYLEISYVNNYVGLVMKDLSYNILLSATTAYTFINNKMPFSIWTNGSSFAQSTIFYTCGIFSYSGTPPTYNF